MNTATGTASQPSTRKALTIGAVTKILQREFDDLSISKIRYLEDQKLLSPRRTPGGYRLYSQADVERLRAILRMQRDEFLPLRVIRQELASGGERDDVGRARVAGARRALSVEGAGASRLSQDELLDQTGVRSELLKELEDFGLVESERIDGQHYYDDSDLEIVTAAGELARYGVRGRNLRVFRTSADREAALLEQVMGPALRSQNQSKKREAIENLETLVAACGNLMHLLLVRDLRRITGAE
ncbi:MAG: MerR family transcriptional regulator [Solirubrobacterales bacterium]